LWSVAAVAAVVAPLRADDAVEADRQDLILLAPLRPLVVRLYITIDRQPFRDAWRERISAAFAACAVDQDQRISYGQAVRLAYQLAGKAGGEKFQQRADDWRQKAIGCDEFVQLLAEIAPALTVRQEPGGGGTAIFGILDVDGDHRLSRDELTKAGELLRLRDFNDDEVITADELVEDPRATARFDVQSGQMTTAAAKAAIVPGPHVGPAEVAQALLAHYDRDHDGRLATTGPNLELSFDETLARAVPPDAQGFITAEALSAHCLTHFDTELAVPVGAAAAGARGRARSGDIGDFSIHRRMTGDFKVEGRGYEIEIRRHNRNPARNPEELFSFAGADGDNNGYLDENECRALPIFAGLFEVVDTDHDGKVLPEEFKPFVETRLQTAAAQIVLRVNDSGQDLFDLLDGAADVPDRQLSIREILTAPLLLTTIDRNGDGYLAGEEVTQRVTIELYRAAAELAEGRAAVSTRQMPTGTKREVTATGPAWFMAMDRNQDGDVSAREFLGSADSFARLDVNRDRLIDAVEAAAALDDATK